MRITYKKFNRLLFVVLVSLLLRPCLSHAQQQQPPFVVCLSGGLFFPARTEFQPLYKVNSDLVWSAGIVLPVSNGLFITGEYGKFNSTGFFDQATDSGAHYEEKFLHMGVINKMPLSAALLFRVSGGISRVNVTETTSSPRIQDKSVGTGNLYGFFGGLGVEESFGDPHFSLYVDVQYDYARSHDNTFSGDFGGTRAVLGLNIILMD